MNMKVKILTIEGVKEFVRIAESFDFEMDLSSIDGRYTVDAKSIMGIFSMDISKELSLKVCGDDEDVKAAERAFAKFIA